jgi:hypothetical protein
LGHAQPWWAGSLTQQNHGRLNGARGAESRIVWAPHSIGTATLRWTSLIPQLLPERSRREHISDEYDSPSSEMWGWLMAKSAKSTAIPLFTMIATAVIVATWAIVVAVHTYGL